jgi:phosphate transport system substrate-binding protein
MLCGPLNAETIRVQGSGTVAQIFTLAAPVVKEKLGVDLKIRTDGSSTSAIHSVAAGAVNLAVTTRSLTADDRSDFPERRMTEALFGVHALVFIVSADVWESGVRSISKAEARAIYEGTTKTWKSLGGPDQPIKFFNPDHGRGVWEFMALWMYGESRKAPLGNKWESVPGGREARDSVGFNAGSISIANPRWVDGKSVFALAIKNEHGTVIEPTTENMQTLKYPFTRGLYLVAGDRPTGNIKLLMNFILSPEGQSLVKKAEFIGLADPKPLE